MRSLKWTLAVGLAVIGCLAIGRPAAADNNCTVTTSTDAAGFSVFNQCPGQTQEFIDFTGTVVTQMLICSSPNGGFLFVTTTNAKNLVGVGRISHHLFTGTSFSFTGFGATANPCSASDATLFNTVVVDTTTGHGFSLPMIMVDTSQVVDGVCTPVVVVDIDRSSNPICF